MILSSELLAEIAFFDLVKKVIKNIVHVDKAEIKNSNPNGFFEKDYLNDLDLKGALKLFKKAEPSIYDYVLVLFKMCSLHRFKQNSEVVRRLNKQSDMHLVNGITQALDDVKDFLVKNINLFVFNESFTLLKELEVFVDAENKKLIKNTFNNNVYVNSQCLTYREISVLVGKFKFDLMEKRNRSAVI